MSLQVNRIKISNVLGIESLDIKPGKVTVISGRNGEGKTSVLEAIKAATKGGHDATLLRNGAELGEVVLVLDDGTRIGKRITPTASTVRVYSGERAEREARPTEALRGLIDALSVNPIEFLTVPKKQQIGALLEAMPLRADVSKLAELIGGPVAPELANAHAIDAIAAVHKAVFDNRTGVNGSIRDKKGTIKQLEAAIPAELAESDSVDENALENAAAHADEGRDAELARIDAKLGTLETAWANKLTDLQAAMDAVKTEREETRAKAEKQRQRARDACIAEKQPITDRLNLIRANRDAAARARATRETITKMQDDLVALETEAETATASLAALDAYKAELLAGLPIPGLQVRDGEIYYGDVLFDRLNTAGKMRVAVEVAKLRAGKLGLMCVDGAEALDAESFAALCEQAAQSDVQLVVTRVADGPMTVESM